MPSKPRPQSVSKDKNSPEQRAKLARVLASSLDSEPAVSIDVDPKRIKVVEVPYTEQKATMQRVKSAALKALKDGTEKDLEPTPVAPPVKRGRGRPSLSEEEKLCAISGISILKRDFDEMHAAINSGEAKNGAAWIRQQLSLAKKYKKTLG